MHTTLLLGGALHALVEAAWLDGLRTGIGAGVLIGLALAIGIVLLTRPRPRF